MRDLSLIPEMVDDISEKGQHTVLHILSAARDVFINDGYGAFSIQKVAKKCKLARGNITYYFPSRDKLLHALLRAVIAGYMQDFDHIMAQADTNAEEKFVAIVTLIMEDLGTRETAIFFPELWALANHNKDAAHEMKQLYDKARKYLVDLIKEINPSLNAREAENVGLYVSATMEGQTPFVGYKGTFHKDLPRLTNIAVYSLLLTVKSIKPNHIRTK